MTKWRDIKTAPKDGTTIIVGGRWPCGEWFSTVARWMALPAYLDEKCKPDWYVAPLWHLHQYNVAFTHWRQPPMPPDQAGEK